MITVQYAYNIVLRELKNNCIKNIERSNLFFVLKVFFFLYEQNNFGCKDRFYLFFINYTPSKIKCLDIKIIVRETIVLEKLVYAFCYLLRLRLLIKDGLRNNRINNININT